jgi:glycosyltransferase involved in cell wall biosynthesis
MRAGVRLDSVVPSGRLGNGREALKMIRLFGAYCSPPASGNVYSRDYLVQILRSENESEFRRFDAINFGADSVPILAAPYFGKIAAIPRILGCYRRHASASEGVTCTFQPDSSLEKLEKEHQRDMLRDRAWKLAAGRSQIPKLLEPSRLKRRFATCAYPAMGLIQQITAGTSSPRAFILAFDGMDILGCKNLLLAAGLPEWQSFQKNSEDSYSASARTIRPNSAPEEVPATKDSLTHGCAPAIRINIELVYHASAVAERPNLTMPLKPCVNLRTLGYRITGVQRYLLSLLPHMPEELNSVRPPRALQGVKGHLWEQFYLPTQLKHRLLWSPGNTGPLGVTRQVVTIHDMASLDHPEWFERKFALWYATLLPRLIHRVHAIITVSRFSRERIVRLTEVEPRRVHVILNGVNQQFRPADLEIVKRVVTDFGLSCPYILFVGSLERRKNLGLLLRAWQSGAFEGVTLAVVGASGHVFSSFGFDSVPAGVHLLGSVPDDVLPSLYTGAAAFVYPSIYEGFGMPPLEAMACGCVVAVSDIPAHREICGEAATYFDPFDPDDLTSKLDWLLRLDNASRAALTKRGLQRAACYCWENAASETWRVLTLAANS